MSENPPLDRGRILWLAVADARGHLMRAHTMRNILAKRGIGVDIVTSSKAGVEFLADFGTPSELMSDHFGVVYDARQDLDRSATESRTLKYLTLPTRCARDTAWLRRRYVGADLAVDDAFHPALLFPPFIPGLKHMNVVHLYGKYMREAVVNEFEGGRGPKFWAKWYSETMGAVVDKSFARVEHTFDAGDEGEVRSRTWRLPPLVPGLPRPAAEVRATLGVAPGQRLAVVYLNPNFTDPTIAGALERVLADDGFKMHAVGEGYAASGRVGWVPRDTRLTDAIATADVLVSAPGMGALAQARLFNTPLLTLVSDQPEQKRNLAFLDQGAGHPYEAVELASLSTMEDRLRKGLRALVKRTEDAPPRPSGSDAVNARQAIWGDVFEDLVRLSRQR